MLLMGCASMNLREDSALAPKQAMANTISSVPLTMCRTFMIKTTYPALSRPSPAYPNWIVETAVLNTVIIKACNCTALENFSAQIQQ
jgi:hypothetical protein